MIRCRFQANDIDPRPINWPLKHPYWISGYGNGYAIVIAYAENENEIIRNWPDAKNLDSEDVVNYTFTSRFPRPQWLGAK